MQVCSVHRRHAHSGAWRSPGTNGRSSSQRPAAAHERPSELMNPDGSPGADRGYSPGICRLRPPRSLRPLRIGSAADRSGADDFGSDFDFDGRASRSGEAIHAQLREHAAARTLPPQSEPIGRRPPRWRRSSRRHLVITRRQARTHHEIRACRGSTGVASAVQAQPITVNCSSLRSPRSKVYVVAAPAA